VLIGLANICERAWRNRLRQANEWLLWLCGELIASPVPPDWVLQRQAGRVLLVDATCIRQVGGTGDDWRLHTAYDLRAGRRGLVSLTDRHGGEELSYYQLQPGDIVIADRGYGFRCSVALARKPQAYVVLRFVIEDEEGGAIDLLAWAEQTNQQVASYRCWYRWEGQRGQVRVIIGRLSEEQAKEARERMRDAGQEEGQDGLRAGHAGNWVALFVGKPTITSAISAAFCLILARLRGTEKREAAQLPPAPGSLASTTVVIKQDSSSTLVGCPLSAMA
jgi:hypothetical protein